MNSLGPLTALSSLTATAAARTTATASPSLTRLALALGGVRHASRKERDKPTPKPPKSTKLPPPGHGERIYIFNHIMANHIVYSFSPVMKANKAFRQFPYTGKKLVPAKLRKDYWRTLAVVEFGAGRGEVGRSVFRGLRELKKRHELEWAGRRGPDGLVVEDEAADGRVREMLRMTRRERGEALNDQRGNAVADLAALLAGRGKGNLVLVEDEGKTATAIKADADADADAKAGPAEAEAGSRSTTLVEVTRGDGKDAKTVKLHTATVYWANEQDKYYAESWTKNVTHVIGLPEKAKETEGDEVMEETESTPAEEGDKAEPKAAAQ